jgi:hypothetical protein
VFDTLTDEPYAVGQYCRIYHDDIIPLFSEKSTFVRGMLPKKVSLAACSLNLLERFTISLPPELP